MRVLLQRVTEASVTVDGTTVATIGAGFVALVGVTATDNTHIAEQMAAKIANLRVFEDAEGKMNLSALDRHVSVLVVSQFTLYADVRKGRRPSFVQAAPPEQARPLVDHLAQAIRSLGLRVETGVFGAHMAVQLTNDGPVTIWLDSATLGF